MRAFLAVAILVAGCCCPSKSAPTKTKKAPEPISEAVTLRNDQGGSTIPLYRSNRTCDRAIGLIARKDWVGLTKLDDEGCDAKGRVKATLTLRTEECWRVEIPRGVCKGTWWVGRDWVE